MQTEQLTGQRALVTGASGGIGAAISEELARRGAYLVLHYGRSGAQAERTLERVRNAGSDGRLVQADLRDGAAIAELARAAGELDILVNNAGISLGGSLESTTEDDFDLTFDTNVKGTFFLTKALVGSLREGGAVVNISSMVSMAAYPNTITYSMAKTALNAFTRSLAVDLAARRITVNAVAPGATDTEFLARARDVPEFLEGIAASTALGRLARPEEIARVVAFLVSDDGAWVTGQVIQASGGMHL